MSNEILTEEEIQELPLWTRCCWYIQGWKKPFIPKSIKEWAKEVGWRAVDLLSPYAAEEAAISKVQCLLKFASNITASTAQNTLDTLRGLKTFQRYMEVEELIWPGWYWWLPEPFRNSPNKKECWRIEYWDPQNNYGPKNGLFVGPIEPPISGKEEREPEIKYTPKICP